MRAITEYQVSALRRVADGDVVRQDDWTYRSYGQLRDMTTRIYALEDHGLVALCRDGSVRLTAHGAEALVRLGHRKAAP